MPPEQERDCQLEMANNENSNESQKKKKKRSWNKPNKKKNCQEVCQIKQILSTSSPCVWKNVFGMAACQNLLSSPTCTLVCLFCQSQIQISLCVEVKEQISVAAPCVMNCPLFVTNRIDMDLQEDTLCECSCVERQLFRSSV